MHSRHVPHPFQNFRVLIDIFPLLGEVPAITLLEMSHFDGIPLWN